MPVRRRTRPPARGAAATAPGRGAQCPRRRFEPPAERPGAAARAAPAWAGAIPVRAAGAARGMVTAGWSVGQARPATEPPAGRRVDLRRRRSAMRPPAEPRLRPPSAPIRPAESRPSPRAGPPEARPAGRAARGRGPRGRARGRTGCRAAPGPRAWRQRLRPRRRLRPRPGRNATSGAVGAADGATTDASSWPAAPPAGARSGPGLTPSSRSAAPPAGARSAAEPEPAVALAPSISGDSRRSAF